MSNESFEERIARLERENNAGKLWQKQHSPDQTEVVDTSDLAPVIGELAQAIPELPDDDWSSEDAAISSLKILDVYKKLTGKNTQKSGGKDELMVFCPSRDHENNNTEAACINVRKNTWVCFGQCGGGGGIIDMIATSNGFPFGKALKGRDYAKVKRITLEQFCGWHYDQLGVGRSPKAQARLQTEFEKHYGSLAAGAEPEPVKSTALKPTVQANNLASLPDTPGNTPKPDNVTSIIPPVESAHEPLPEISDPLKMIPPGTPLYEYIVAHKPTTVPVEYVLFQGHQLLSFCGGPLLRGKYGKIFKSSLAVLLLGIPGLGKSTSINPAKEILRTYPIFSRLTLPPINGEKFGTSMGIHVLPDPASGEVLIDHLGYTHTMEGIKYPIRDTMAWMCYDELKKYTGKSGIQGSTLDAVLQELENVSSLDDKLSTSSRSGGTLEAINPCVNITMGTQPGALKELLGQQKIDNGFLSRFCVVTGNPEIAADPEKDIPNDLTYCGELFNEVALYYDNLMDRDNRSFFFIEVDSSAKELMRQSYQKASKWKFEEDIKSRFDLFLYKLSLLFAMNRRALAIMSEDINAAMWVLEYLNRSASLTAQKTSGLVTDEMEEGIKKAIILIFNENKRRATRDAICSRMGANRKGWSKEDVDNKIFKLLRAGIIIEDPKPAKAGKQGVPAYLLPYGYEMARPLRTTSKQGDQ